MNESQTSTSEMHRSAQSAGETNPCAIGEGIGTGESFGGVEKEQQEIPLKEGDSSQDFLLFSNFAFYPLGGMWDFVGIFGTLDDAREAALEFQREARHDWYHIVDRQTMKVVESEGDSCYASSEDFQVKNS